MPAVELGAVDHCLATGRLRDQAFSFAQGLAQGFLHCFAERGHLASHLALQPANDGALAFDDFADALELAGMGVAPSLVVQQLAFFGVSLLELDAIGFGRLHHLGPGYLQQLAVGGVCHGFLFHCGVHDYAGQLFLGNQLERDGHLHGAGQQFFNAFFAKSFTKAPQLCQVARPLRFKILVARKVLPSGCLAPALDHVLIALVERMFEEQEDHHQTGGQTRPAGIGDAATVNGRDRAKQVQALDLIARLDPACPALRKGSFYLLLKHAVGQHRQRAGGANRSSDRGGCGKSHRSWHCFQNSQKKRFIEYLFESYDHPDSHLLTCVNADFKGFADSINNNSPTKNL